MTMTSYSSTRTINTVTRTLLYGNTLMYNDVYKDVMYIRTSHTPMYSHTTHEYT